jgi:hypothetical protein
MAFAGSAQALAAQRYASPTGSGTACSSGSPCSIQTAFTDQNLGDEIIVAPGDYNSIATNLFVYSTSFAHGVYGQPPPRIHMAGGRYVAATGGSSRLSYVQIDGAGSEALDIDAGSEGDQISVHTTSGNACLVYGTLIDSVCWASGAGDEAIDGAANANFSPVIRNVTAEATGSGSIGIEYHTSGSGHINVTASNVIAHGTATDIQTQADLPATTIVNLDHSNFISMTPLGSGGAINSTVQQTAAPSFVNAGAGDFNEVPGSPTIDAGVTSPANGAFDYLGRPRVINGMTDIGAAEYDPFNGVIIGGGKVRLKKGKAPVKLTCPAATPPPCAGTLTLRYRHGSKTSTAGKATFSLDAGASAKVKVKIKKPALRRLVDRGKLKVTASADATDGAGTFAGASGKVKLKA